MGLTWNYGDLLEAVGRRVPDRVALVHDDRPRTWGEVDARSNRVARALLGTPGVAAGAHIAFCATNSADYLEALTAAFKARLVHLNINYRYAADELLGVLDRGDAEILVYDSAFAEQVERLAPRLAKIRLFVEVGEADARYGGAVAYERLAGDGDGSPLEIERSGDDLFLLYTGGTTGTPKAVIWRQADRLAVYRQGRGDATPEAFLDRMLARKGERVLPAAPLMHSTGLTVATRALTAGGSVVTASGPFDAASVWDQAARHRVDSLAIVGDAFARPLLDALDDGTAVRLDSLAAIVSAGVMWSQEVKQGLLRLLPHVHLVDSLGSSEGSGLGMSVTDSADAAATAVFRIGGGCKVFTPDHREVQPGSGQAGLIAKSGAIPVGYHGDPERTAATFPVIDGVRYAIPGDWCTVGADGTITLLGRDSSCINTGGEKVFAEEVEEALKSLDGIDDALVVGVPDPRWGHAVAAVVQSDAALDSETVRRSLRDRLAGYKIPKRVLVVEQMPRTASGKADYAAVRRLLDGSGDGRPAGEDLASGPADDYSTL